MTKNFLRDLARDTVGNTLAIFAVALVPMTIMVGSGLDIGVTYMARAKLQNACDAAVLGARQSMDGNLWTTQDEAEGQKFFNFNFPAATHNVTGLDFDIRPDAADSSQIVGVASANVPTSLMSMFGFNSLSITANCDAKRDLGHNDVLLVLDVTGSMAQAPSSGSGSKISRLRSGAAGLYRALDDAASGSVTRYGFVPYSHTVNVARSLRTDDILRNSVYVNGEWEYDQCKVGYYSNGNGYLYDCEDKDSNDRPSFGFVNTSNGQRYNINIAFDHDGTRSVNILDTQWRNGLSENDSVDAFRTSGNGCIEERRSIAESGYTMNENVARADIDTLFSGTAWDLRFGRYDPNSQRGQTQVGCPSEAKRLASYSDEAGFTAAVGQVTARVTGGTYHDVGMLWGTRFLSQTGFFAANNPTEIGAVPVNMHIVFMTDGILDVDKADGSNDLYSAHSLERYLNRTNGGGSNLSDHRSRFLSACATARAMGMTVWVIALDVTNSSDIRPCATSGGHFFESDGSDLEDKFAAIGQGIGNLRLTR